MHTSVNDSKGNTRKEDVRVEAKPMAFKPPQALQCTQDTCVHYCQSKLIWIEEFTCLCPYRSARSPSNAHNPRPLIFHIHVPLAPYATDKYGLCTVQTYMYCTCKCMRCLWYIMHIMEYFIDLHIYIHVCTCKCTCRSKQRYQGQM